MEDPERRKRSRFDQTEPERRPSRFDRRSRSPPTRRPENTRERSPRRQDSPDADKSAEDPAAAAAAAAARINAQLQARKGIQHVDVPPIKPSSSSSSSVLPTKPPTGPSATSPTSASSPAPAINGEVYMSDGDYMKDIEINDLRNRYTLTKGPTQKMIKELTGADVTTRGSYYPDKSMATASNPPLYLHITSTSKEGLEKAVSKIEELMRQELPNLVDERRFRRRDEVEKDEFGRRKWKEEKIPIDLEPLPGFNLRAQVVGHGGQYVKHIQGETGCRVQIKGRGSGYLEQATNRESDEEMFLHVTGPDPVMVEKGKELCEDLILNVREQYEDWKKRPPPPPRFGGGGYGDRDRGDRGDRDRDRDRDRGDRDRGYHGGYHGHGGQNNHGRSGSYGQAPYQGGGDYGSHGANEVPANPAAGNGAAVNMSDYAAQYAQYYGGADPYAAYGGYAGYYQWYQNYMASQGQQAATQSPAPGASASPPPPPPPSDAAPPPPPPTSAPPPPPPGAPGSGGGYNAVPPPPGL